MPRSVEWAASQQGEPAARSGLRGVAHRLDVVPVRPEDIRAVVERVIALAHAGWAVVQPACGQGRLVELADLLPALGRERDVDGTRTRAERADPELGLAGAPEHGPALVFQGNADAQRRQRSQEERLAV